MTTGVLAKALRGAPLAAAALCCVLDAYSNYGFAQDDPHASLFGPRSAGTGLTDEDARRLLRPAGPAGDAAPDPAVPKGTVEVTVIDAVGQPLAEVRVEVGIMHAEGSTREHLEEMSGRDGVARFANLATGSNQAYRVNVVGGGAKFSTNPFRLPEDHGVRARVMRRRTTREDRVVFVLFHWVLLEFRDARLHVAQQAQLVNLSQAQYVFPEKGLALRLPPGATAFQMERSMGDQRMAHIPGEGVHLSGSLPPGRTDITWAFDLPVAGASEVAFSLPVIFRTMQVRVDSDAPEGLILEVAGLPPAEVGFHEGRRLLETGVQRRPDAPSAREPLALRLLNIPGAVGAKTKWVALGLACIFLVGAFIAIFRVPPGEGYRALARVQRATDKKRLLAELEVLEAASADEVGPEYRARRRGELTDELSLLLRDEAAAAAAERGIAGRAATASRSLPYAHSASLARSTSDARRQLTVGLFGAVVFAVAFPFLGVFFVGALRNALDATAKASGEEKARLRGLVAIAAICSLLWVAGLVAGAAWLAHKLM